MNGAARLHADVTRAHRMCRAFLRTTTWEVGELHLAMRHFGYTPSLSIFTDWVERMEVTAIYGTKIMFAFFAALPPGATFADWRRANATETKNGEEIARKRMELEQERERDRRRHLAQEMRGAGPGRRMESDFDGLDAETIRALSGGTIKTPRAADGYGYA